MSEGSQSTTIEGFITDKAFVNRGTNSNILFPTNTANVGELSSNALSFLSNPVQIGDKRNSGDRVVNWAAQTSPQLIVDGDLFSNFVDVIQNSSVAVLNSLFALIDKLLFNYKDDDNHAAVESFLTTDAGTKNYYVPGSFHLSSLIVTDRVYFDTNNKQIPVPSYATLEVALPSGSSTQNFILKLYTSIEAWLTGYSHSTIVDVIPPLPYDKLYSASLSTTTDNIFSTASLTASLSYATVQASLRTLLVSGMSEFIAVLVDNVTELPVPFNIVYKGRPPTKFEIRLAIKNALLTSGVGDETGWKARIPGIFITGRFYIVPFWDKYLQKPDQLIYPNILDYNEIKESTNTILSSLGYSDITENMDVFSLYYNHMTASAIPDRSGGLDVAHLKSIIPDYQSYSTSDEQFAYMLYNTQVFTRDLNTVLTIDSGGQASVAYGPYTEGLLSFYSYTVGTFEICVITKSCYETIMESEL